MSVTNTVLFLIVVFMSFLVQALTGFGGPLIAMPICILLCGLAEARAALGVVACATSLIIALRFYKHINVKELIRMLIGVFGGMLIGLWMYDTAPKPLLLKILGAIVLFVALKNLFVKKQWVFPTWLRYAVLLLSGIMQGLFLSAGAFLIMYAQQVFEEKQEFRSTVSALFAVTNGCLIVNQAVGQGYTAEILPLVLSCLAVGIGASIIGNRVQKGIPKERFITITNVILLISGAILLINSRG